MAINPNKSFTVGDGITFEEGSSVWIGGGDEIPTFNAPEGSRYFRTSPPELYVQEGTGETNSWAIFSGSGSGDSVSEDFTQAGHGLSVGDAVRYSSGSWVLAQADTAANSESLGIVSSVSGDDITITYSGRITGLSGLTADTVYYLDASTAGDLTTTEPTISKPMLFATSTTEAIVLVMRAMTGSAEPDKIYRYGHSYAITGQVKVVSGDNNFIPPFFVSLASGQTTKLVKARYQIKSGTSATVKLQKNDVDITGFTGMTATTTPASTAPTGVSLAEDDKINLVVTGVAGTPKNLSFTMFFEVTT